METHSIFKLLCVVLYVIITSKNFKGLVPNYCNYLILYKKNTEVLHQALKI